MKKKCNGFIENEHQKKLPSQRRLCSSLEGPPLVSERSVIRSIIYAEPDFFTIVFTQLVVAFTCVAVPVDREAINITECEMHASLQLGLKLLLNPFTIASRRDASSTTKEVVLELREKNHALAGEAKQRDHGEEYELLLVL
jgi:hypothetical protein